MERLRNLIDRPLSPEYARVNSPKILPLEAPLAINGNATKAYEIEVFNALLRDRSMLGIKQVNQCRNVRIDGVLELDDGRRLALEIKYRMNWPRACQALAQVSRFKNNPATKEYGLSGAVVVFQEFSGDWALRKPKWFLQNGWNYWLTDHEDIEGLPTRLLRFRGGAFESYEMALAAAQATATV